LSQIAAEAPAGALSLPRSLGTLIAARLTVDAAFRAPIPILGIIAASFGQSADSTPWLAVALTLAPLLGPVFGALSNRIGGEEPR
jgi:hypothetical protein